MNTSTEKKIIDLENRLAAAWGEREGVGGIRSLGLKDAIYCSWNGFTMRLCCVALRTMSRYLITTQQWEKKVCIHVCVTCSPCCTAGEKKIRIKNKFKKDITRQLQISISYEHGTKIPTKY